VIVFSERCRREIKEMPESIRGDLADALARLDAGLHLSMSLSRPMPSIGKGVHVLHAFKKTTESTPKRNLEIAQRRLKEHTS